MPEPSLKAIIGLGNPGAEYERTRHNAGFWFVDALAEAARGQFRVESKFLGETARIRYDGHDLLLLKPSTFMNRSGQSAQALASFYKLAPGDLLIAHDELDLPAGVARLKLAGGHGGHNGLRSLHQHLGEQYRRLRIGIGHPGHRDQVLNYVLGRASVSDEQKIRDSLGAALDALPVWLGQSWDKAVQRLNTKSDSEPKPE